MNSFLSGSQDLLSIVEAECGKLNTRSAFEGAFQVAGGHPIEGGENRLWTISHMKTHSSSVFLNQ